MKQMLFLIPALILMSFPGFSTVQAFADRPADPEAMRLLKVAKQAKSPKARPELRSLVTVPNTNDTCDGIFSVNAEDYYDGDTSFATSDGDCSGQVGVGRDVWFVFTPETTGTYYIEVDSYSFEPVLSIHDACPGTAQNELTCVAGEYGYAWVELELTESVDYVIRVAGQSGTGGDYSLYLENTTPTASIVFSNDHIEVAVDESGNFTLAVAGSTQYDDSRNLLYGHPEPWSGGTTLRVDGTDYWNYYNDPLGTVVQKAQTEGQTNVTIWEADGVRLTQRLRLVAGAATGVEDTLMMEYEALNIDDRAHSVGIRAFLDTWLGETDGAPFRVPGLGYVTHERELVGMTIPQFWTGFDNLVHPVKISQGTLIGSQAVRPDRVVWGYWPLMASSAWIYFTDPGQRFSSPDGGEENDSAVYVYWNPVALDPGQSRRVVTYYGLSAVDIDLEPPLALGVTSVNALENIDNRYSPNPFTVTAFVEHAVDSVLDAAEDVCVEILLPEGLELNGQNAQCQLGTMYPGASHQVYWLVQANAYLPPAGLTLDSDSTTLEYQVRISTSNLSSKQVTRSVSLPMLKNHAIAWTLYK